MRGRLPASTLASSSKGPHRAKDASMDGPRFDTLTKRLATPGSRRRALTALVAGSLSLLGWASTEDIGAHNALEECKKKSGKAKKRCIKKARAHNATHTTTPRCTPSCAGKECGPDECSGVCGTCGAGERCEAGQCVCVPQCGGRTCGSDGCGSQCGTCRDVETCQDGNCTCAAPGPGDSCSSAAECCAYTALDERSCTRGDGFCSSIFSTCRYGLGGRCSNSCDCMGDLVCVNGSCVCPDGREYVARGGCCARGLTRCGNRCCSLGGCLCLPEPFGCRCSDPF
jgi:hypothetical protein